LSAHYNVITEWIVYFNLICKFTFLAKRTVGKGRDGVTIEKKQQELEKRLENVKGALGAPTKKTPKKGILHIRFLLTVHETNLNATRRGCSSFIIISLF
jgi:hypothetical protein